MHAVWVLAFATFALAMGLAYWMWLSGKRHQQHGGHSSGIGGPNDPFGSRPTEELGRAAGNPNGPER